MLTMKFDETTDVWSFGITVLEVYTGGGQPYAGVPNSEVMGVVQSGIRPPQPATCPDAVYALMLKCWSPEPMDRPDFSKLVAMLSSSELATAAVHLKQHVKLGGTEPEHALASVGSAPKYDLAGSAPEYDLAATDRTTGNVGYDNITSAGAPMRAPARLVDTSGYLTVGALNEGLEAEQGRRCRGDMVVSFARGRASLRPHAHTTHIHAGAHTHTP